jgi:chemotaxis protein MotB
MLKIEGGTEMSIRYVYLSIICFAVFALGGCVSKGDYLKKEAETNQLSEQVTDLNKRLKESNDALAEAKAEIAKLKVKEAKVESESNTYKQLMQEMKGEIAKGQVAINEYKGKLTVDVANQILFASGEAEVKKEGVAILKRVVDILKGVKDKAIRVEGHTDNKKIYGSLAKRYPTNWELSAARSINVTKFLAEEGITPDILSAVAYGEYKPVADNSTEEGRQKNRRIAIILLPKD